MRLCDPADDRLGTRGLHDRSHVRTSVSLGEIFSKLQAKRFECLARAMRRALFMRI